MRLRGAVLVTLWLAVGPAVAWAQGQVLSATGESATLSVGSRDGVTIGTTGKIKQKVSAGDRQQAVVVAYFRVTRVEAQTSAATLTEATAGVRIGKGDEVVFDRTLVPLKKEAGPPRGAGTPARGSDVPAGVAREPPQPQLEGSWRGSEIEGGTRRNPGGSEVLTTERDVAAAARRSFNELKGQGDSFTLQLVIACSPDTVVRFVSGRQEAFVLPARVGSRDCYRVCWGVYSTAAEAEAARLPPQLIPEGHRPRATPLRDLLR